MFPFSFWSRSIPLHKVSFFACTIPLFSLCKNQTVWQTSPGLTEHKCWSDYSVWSSQLELFSTLSNFPLSSTWLVSTSRGFVQLQTTLEPSLCFCLNTFNRILDFLQLKNILPRHLPPMAPEINPILCTASLTTTAPILTHTANLYNFHSQKYQPQRNKFHTWNIISWALSVQHFFSWDFLLISCSHVSLL